MTIRLHSYLKRNRFGIFYFRRVIPLDLRNRFAFGQIARSTRTCNSQEAQSLALRLSASVDLLFTRIRNKSRKTTTTPVWSKNRKLLGLNVEVIAVIVLAGLLGGPLGEYLSTETQNAVASLQDHARQATEAIREMGHHGSALVRVTADRAGRDILRPDQADAVEETLQRVARFRDLLDHLQN